MIEVEKRHRINVALWAYSYEIMDDPIVSDVVFDQVCLLINPKIETGNTEMDSFFRKEFDPSTGMWIYKHPQITGILKIYQRLTGKIGKPIILVDKGENKGAVSKSPFNSHFQSMLYLAYLGFNIVPGWMDGVSYRAEGNNLYLEKDGIEKVIPLSEIFEK